MTLKDIYLPISDEMNRVRDELESQVFALRLESCYVKNVMDYFLKTRGKMLRPALLLLSARSVIKRYPVNSSAQIKLAAAVELIHCASLIHDDVVDESAYRRGQPAIQSIFDDKTAILAGDLLFARAFALLGEYLDGRILTELVRCVEQMCLGEFEELEEPIDSLSKYIEIITRKTAGFMAACCRCGAMSAGLEKERITALGEFGEYFGITYQVIDDFHDQDVPLSIEVDFMKLAQEYSDKALGSIDGFEASEYKKSMEGLVHYVMGMYASDSENIRETAEDERLRRCHSSVVIRQEAS